MKILKRAIVAGMALASMAAVAACDNKTYDVNGAAKRVMLEQDKKENVTADFEVAKKVVFNNADYSVTWTSNNEYAIVKEIEGNDSKLLIDIEYVKNQTQAQEVKLTAEVKDPKGATVTKEFNFKVPKFIVNTIADYDASQKGDQLTIKGTVVAREAYNAKDKITNLYMSCDEGGFEAYKVSCTEEEYNSDLTVGSVLYIAGLQATYNGLRELSPCSYFVTGEAKKTITPEDLTSKVADGTGITKAYQGHMVELKNVLIVSVEDKTADQYSIIVGDPTNTKKQATVRISKYFAPKDSELRNEIDGLNLVPGQTISVKGFVGWYNAPQVTICEKGAITAGSVDYSKGFGLTLLSKVTFPAKVYGVKTISLPSSLYEAGYYGDEHYAGLTAEWTSNSANATIATKDVPAVEAKAATETTKEVKAVPAYTTSNLTTKKVTADETVDVTLTVKNAAGETVFTATKQLKLVKDYVVDNHATYLKATDGESVTIQGTVAYVDVETSAKYGTQGYFTVVDAKGNAYYVFQMTLADDETKAAIVAGKKVVLSGTKKVYGGVHELTSAELLKVEDGTVVEPTAITELPKVTDALQAQYVTFTGTIKELSENKRTVTVTVGTKDILVYLSRNQADITKAIAVGDNITVKGIYSVNSGNSQVITLTADSVVKNAA